MSRSAVGDAIVGEGTVGSCEGLPAEQMCDDCLTFYGNPEAESPRGEITAAVYKNPAEGMNRYARRRAKFGLTIRESR
jgi:hypothetical protein